MKTGKRFFFPILWMSILTLLLVGFQSQTQKLPTQAADSLGFGLLEQARQLKSEQKFGEGFTRALEASQAFRQRTQWQSWAESYEEAFQCVLKSKADPLYNALLLQLMDAAQILPRIKEMPAAAQVIIWRRIGSIHHHFGAYDQAALFYEKALPYAEQSADSALLMRLYANTAIVIWTQGDDYRSIQFFEKALSLATAQRDTPVIAAILTNLGNSWRTLHSPKAAQVYMQSLALSPDNSETLMLLSKAYIECENNPLKALEAANKAFRFAASGEEKSDALHQLGRVNFVLKAYDRALSYYDQALAVAVKSYGKNHPECAKIHVFKGRAFQAKKNYTKALGAYNQALDDLLPLFSPSEVDQNPSESELTTTNLWIIEALLDKAKVYEQLHLQSNKQEDLVRSLECAELALYYQNKIKMRYGDDESKFALGSYFLPSCDAALHSAFKLYREKGALAYAQRAFRISEQTKAVVLAEALYKKEMKQVASVPPALLETERRHQEQIAYFEKRIQDTDESSLVQLFKDSLFQAKRQLEIQEQQILADYPTYGAALFSYRSEVAVDSVQRNLPDDTAMLEYFLGDSSVYTFLLTKDTFWVQEQALPQSFDQTASAFLRTVNDWHFVNDSSALAGRVFLDNGSLLYRWLLEKPLAVTAARRLFIVPDGKLSLLPFELLLTQPYSGQWIDRDVPFLMKERAVSYRFSCRNQAVKTTHPPEGWGGFGLEYDERTLSALDNTDNTIGFRNFGPLPFADDEIMAIRGVLGGAFWLNQDATRENFLKNAEHYGILHLAMHGVVDERNPLRSRLLFSRSLTGDDPFVYASDLYNLQLTAGLSVLSACQSGTGAWKKGEGVLSLARAFAFAGCPSMVMSLWNVSDQSTSELMVSFYEQLKKGATKDEALRSAKLQYLQTVSPEYAKPVYWAAFVPIGEMNSLPDTYFPDENRRLLYWAALLLLLGVILWMGIRWRKRRG